MIAPEEVSLSPLNLVHGRKEDTGRRSNRLNLTFEDVSYSVREGYLSRKRKKILSNVSGDFRPSELTAIMGPSGAGKTTLMNVLSGFATSSSTGTVRVNGRIRDLSAFRRSSAYIMQDGNLQPLLTVQEVMRIAADLKLDTSPADKQLGVDQIIREMGLEKVRTTCTGKLSGGEQKRLTIALELISNPPIMFFDEPTSGLDSVASRQCIGVLKSLARDGRTVVCTIHQPSAPILEMIDHLYVIANGFCVYTGKPSNLVNCLGEMGLRCPSYHNPADYLLEIISGEYGDQIPKLVEASGNGRNERWRDFSSSEEETKNLKIRELDIVPKLPLPETSIFYEFDAKGSAYYATGFWRQWFVLMRRNVIKLSRDTVLMYLRLFIHFIVAFLIGVIFFRTGDDASYARSNFNMMFFNIMTVMFNAFNSTITTFPEEMPILMREHFNRWYKLRSFFIAMKLTDFPIQITAVSTYIVTVWLMSGQIMEFWRLGFTILICVLISLVAQNVGLMCGSVLNVKMGVIFGPLTILPFMIFSGFFVRMADAHPILHWLFHISIFKYAFEGVMIAIYGYDRQKMNCTASEDGLTYCHYSSPKILLKEFHMLYSDYWFAASVLFGLYVVLNVTAYMVLHFKLRKR